MALCQQHTHSHCPNAQRFIFKYKGFVTERGQGHRQCARGPGAQVEMDMWTSWLPGAITSPVVPCLRLGPSADAKRPR